MKKIFITAAMLVAVATASAQTVYNDTLLDYSFDDTKVTDIGGLLVDTPNKWACVNYPLKNRATCQATKGEVAILSAPQATCSPTQASCAAKRMAYPAKPVWLQTGVLPAQTNCTLTVVVTKREVPYSYPSENAAQGFQISNLYNGAHVFTIPHLQVALNETKTFTTTWSGVGPNYYVTLGTINRNNYGGTGYLYVYKDVALDCN